MHTPGPWIVRDKKRSWWPIHVKQLGCEKFLPGICEIPPGADQLANARLIAAAPDLLEACRNLAELAEEVDRSRDGWLGEDPRRAREYAREGHAAIAKASEQDGPDDPA